LDKLWIITAQIAVSACNTGTSATCYVGVEVCIPHWGPIGMEVIVMRHGEAMPADQAAAIGLSDGERPLTDKGRRDTRAAATGLRHTLGDSRVNYMLVSPLLRARQSAEIVRAYLDDPLLDEADALQPDAGAKVIDATLHAGGNIERLLLVGHAPALGIWVSWSLTRKHDRLMALSKNGAALVEFPGIAEG